VWDEVWRVFELRNLGTGSLLSRGISACGQDDLQPSGQSCEKKGELMIATKHYSYDFKIFKVVDLPKLNFTNFLTMSKEGV
jgi:hypothetical protein